jgi:hypothetical protein
MHDDKIGIEFIMMDNSSPSNAFNESVFISTQAILCVRLAIQISDEVTHWDGVPNGKL